MPSASTSLHLADDCLVVVGFGPVGAVAALAAARAGRQVVVLEADPALRTDPAESRASTFHPPTLEMLAELGVYDELVERGLVAATYQMRDRQQGVIAHFDLGLLAGDTRYPFRLQSEQQNLVAIIERHLRQLPDVRFLLGTPVLGVSAEADRTQLQLGGAGPSMIEAGWVIAADGANSAIRQGLGTSFDGLTYPERFLVISTTFPMDAVLPDIAAVNYVSDAHEWFVLLRTPRHWRVLFPVADQDERSLTDPSGLQARLQGIAPIDGEYPISHVTLYNVHQRIAGTFRHNRVLLAGDAGHINNPLGGMGMNSGIHDAMAAVAALDLVERGDASAPDRYDQARRAAARDVVQRATHRNWEQLQERDPAVRAERNDRMRAIAADPAQAREYLLRSAMLEPRPATVAPLTG
jgi:3-(3-hydroxy-phenyl)propionate hydroxylase